MGGFLLGAPLLSSAQTVERVEVTGSRIESVGAVSNSPITSIGAEEVMSSAPVVIEEVFRGLPAAVPAIGANTNNGSGGIATVDLRGLGPQRTLVLINGRRAVPADLNARVDTNMIPVSLIERVDLVTGGASAVYGADAVAGVVNFVLKRNFTGIDASGSYGLSEQGDAKRVRADLTVGANLADGKGNVTVSFGTTRTDPLTQGERSFGQFQISSTNGLRGGSLTAAPATFGGMPAADGYPHHRRDHPACCARPARPMSTTSTRLTTSSRRWSAPRPPRWPATRSTSTPSSTRKSSRPRARSR
jgi:outer membrane receptor protein involved in Fe transport